jgi:hypothetical protein
MLRSKLRLASAILAMAFGCGDSDPVDPVDPRELPEGGGIRLESMQMGSSVAPLLGLAPEGDRAYIHNSEVFFFRDQTPARADWPPVEFDLGRQLADGTTCYRMEGKVYAYGVSGALVNQAVMDTRTYLDVGSSITLTTADGFSASLVGVDQAVSPLQNFVHGRLYYAPEEDYFPSEDIPAGLWYDIVPDGLPEFSSTNGVSLFGTERPEQFGAYRPKIVALQYPVETEFMQKGLALKTDEDLVVSLSPADPAAGTEVFSVVTFLGSPGRGLVHLFNCRNDARKSDTLTIPREVVQELGNDGGAAVIFRRSGSVYEYDGRSFFSMGFACVVSAFCVDDPEATDNVCSAPEAETVVSRLAQTGSADWAEALRVPDSVQAQ